MSGQYGGGGGSAFTSYDTLVGNIASVVHRWKFEEASGNLLDSVGNLILQPTLTGTGSITYGVASPLGNGITFVPGTGVSHLTIASGTNNIPTVAAARTIIAVYKAAGGAAFNANSCLWAYGTTGSTRQLFNLYINAAGTAGQTQLGVWADDLAVAGTPGSGSFWHLVAGMYDGNASNGYIYMFLDGSSYGRGLGGTLNTTPATNFTVGIDTGPANQFSGTITDLIVCNAVLPIYQLDQLWGALAGALA